MGTVGTNVICFSFSGILFMMSCQADQYGIFPWSHKGLAFSIYDVARFNLKKKKKHRGRRFFSSVGGEYIACF